MSDLETFQIDRLAEFIMAEVPGEPSQSEGAVDCAIRIIRTLLAERAALRDTGWVDPEEAARLRGEYAKLRGDRIVSVVFGHHRGAPRPFGLYRRQDVSGVSGTGLVALGAEWPDGTVVLRWTSDWPTSVVFHDRGIESVQAIHGHDGRTEIVWLSEELDTLAELEAERDALLPVVEAARQRINALESLLAHYRAGSRPSEKLHRELEQSKAAWVAAVDLWESRKEAPDGA